MTLLAISGSLRSGSYNTAALLALGELAPAGVEIGLYQELARLPLFNPDNDDPAPAVVQRLREQVNAADGLVIASPEYAHGISGVMKNALDWLVSAEGFVGKPVMLVNTSPRAYHAQEALREVVTTMSGCIVESASVEIYLLGSNLNAAGIRQDEHLASPLAEGLEQFVAAIRARPGTA